MQEAKVINDISKTETKSKKSKSNGVAIAGLIIAVLALLGTGFNTYVLYKNERHNASSFVQDFSLDSNSANFTEGSIADVANRVSDSVVSIVTEVKTTSYSFFYGPTESTGAAAGTGIIISKDGYILTNKHVIDGATKIYVVLNDGTAYKDVELLGTDPLNDVAFLKVANVSDLKPATLGDSKTIVVGEQVIAIGNALGQYQNTVTSGIISGTGRSITATDESYQNEETLVDMIQTDAAINSGNSGGPLVNAAGEVIGLNTAVSSGNDIGFAIPISSIKGMLSHLLSTGEVKRAYAGVVYSNINAATAIESDLGSTYGAYISNVVKGSPAASAGIKEKDIVLAVNGIKIGASTSLGSLLGEHSIGDTVTLTILRNGEKSTVDLTLVEYKE